LGFIEATGVAQHYRDARIAPIYEGTNGIQAIDLVGRKVMRDRGVSARALIETMQTGFADVANSGVDDLETIAAQASDGIRHLARATDWLIDTGVADKSRGLAAATPYLALFGTVAGGWLLARSALAAHRRKATDSGVGNVRAKQIVAGFYAANILPQAGSLATAIISGSDPGLSLAGDQF
jgi:hypothetical protein